MGKGRGRGIVDPSHESGFGRGRGRGRGSGGGRTDDIREEVFEPDSSEQVNNEQIQRQENNPTINEQVGGLKLGTPVLKTPDHINSPEIFFQTQFFSKDQPNVDESKKPERLN